MTAPGSLRRRLLLAASVWLVLGLGLGGLVLGTAFRDSIELSFQARLEAHLRGLAALVQVEPDGGLGFARPVPEPRFDQPLSGWYWQLSGAQGPLLRSRSLWDAALPASAGGGGAQVHVTRAQGPRGEDLLLVERDLEFPGRPGLVHVAVAADRSEVVDEARRFDLLLLAALGILGGGLLAAVWTQVGYGLRPLRRLAAEVKQLREGQRLGRDYPTEVAPLVSALNQVLDHDARLIEGARNHLGNLAHGLKTPLAVLRAELESGRPDPQVTGEQMERMARLIDQNLARARAQASSVRALGGSVAVAPVAESLVGVLRRVHDRPGLTLTLDCPPEARFSGSADDLAEILGTLADNACKWARGRVLVRARMEPALVLAVEDDGPGLTEAQIAEATRRGARFDETMPGSGLGLAIADDLIRLHGGRLDLDRSTLGGLRALVRF